MKLSKEMNKRLCGLTEFIEKKESNTHIFYYFEQTDIKYEFAISKNVFQTDHELNVFPITVFSNASFIPEWLNKLEKEINDDFFLTNRVLFLTKNCRRPLRNCAYFFSIEKNNYNFYHEFLFSGETSLYSISIKHESYLHDFFASLQRERYQSSVKKRTKDRIILEIK